MGLFDIFRGADINEGVVNFQQTVGAQLIDVREPNEFADGHIPQSKNVPLSKLAIIEVVVPDKATPLFIYCASGARSGRALGELKQLGYANVTNIGGIATYRGKIER